MTRSFPTVPVALLARRFVCGAPVLPRQFAIALALWLPGCAMSAIVDSDDASFDTDGSFEESQGSASDLDDATEEGEAEDDAPGSTAGTGSTRDAGKLSTTGDAGSVRADAAVQDGAVRDAGSRDAGRIDGGTGAVAPPPTAPPRDAGRPSTTIPDGRMCRAASDCTQSCVPIGILTCCRDNGTCGCTWAPGAYCL